MREGDSIANYLITHYKGVYRLRTEVDKFTNNFPREYTGIFAENDVYIDCINHVRIHHFGKSILEVYIPSKGRGRNIIKAIKENLGDDVIFHIEETDSEVLFRFNAKDMNRLAKYLKPRTNGADRSPYSTKNLQKTKYIIPDEDLVKYQSIVAKIPRERIIAVSQSTNKFIKSLATKKNRYENIKADMVYKGLGNKEYVHSIGKWQQYIDYLRKEFEKE